MIPPSLDQTLNFIDLLQKFRAIERRTLVKDSDRRESDAEHSFSLAMLTWYVNETYGLNLDTNKLLKYALAHDLVELYSGDTFFYDKQDIKDGQEKREEEAAHILRENCPEFPELHEIIQRYTKQDDAESRFIYALDKIEPMMNGYQDNGRMWRKEGISLEMIRTMKTPKVAGDITVKKIFEELIARMKDRENELFNNK
ncbi:MAG: HD domain-containing protein [Candidatus Pacebacteria bacterium]|nr:HD domain-containing protein [Candidatus Paceibacterota bacterium]